MLSWRSNHWGQKLSRSNPRWLRRLSPPHKVLNQLLSNRSNPLLPRFITIYQDLPRFTLVYHDVRKIVMLSIIWKFTNHMNSRWWIKVIDRFLIKLNTVQPALYLVQNQILLCIINRTSTKLYFSLNINIQRSDRF